MIEHWCGKFRGLSVALSAAAFVACAPRSYDLGNKGTGGGAGAEEDGVGGSASGSGGKGGKGGTTGGTGTGGSSIVGGGGGGGNVGQGSGGSAAGTTGATGGSGAFTLVETPHVLRFNSNKLDLLFMVDNSLGMAEKQATLAQAVPALMAQLTTPPCLDASGTPTGDRVPHCPPGSAPAMDPITDIHAGVITSSLGDHGSGDVCSDAQDARNQQEGLPPRDYNDKAQLLPSVRSGLGTDDFLVWDAATVANPTANAALTQNLTTQILAAGERGCGYEAQLEAWYRFLVDPEPVESMDHDENAASVRGAVNQTVLAQRAAFLRPDSVVAIVMLTDENDCSILDEDGSQGWLTGYKGGIDNNNWRMPAASEACAHSPNDPCCRPCAGEPPAGCPDNEHDLACRSGRSLSANDDSMNLRCFHQKTRFGVDLLYPTERYTEALQNYTIHPRLGGPELPNPLYVAPDGIMHRNARVVLAGVVGAPWQDLATNDSLSGRRLDYLTSSEIGAAERWNLFVGIPSINLEPRDPLMIESIDPRPTGAAHPVVDDAAIAAFTEDANVNPINGHEQAVLTTRDDLQFACIYPLAEPIDCDDGNADACDCNADEVDKHSPLCTGVTATTDGTQAYGKAYPSTRELEVLAAPTSVVASACPKNTVAQGDDDPDVGYVPALRALAAQLREPLGYSCGPSSARGAACTIVEARPLGSCDCDPDTGRTAPSGFGLEVVDTGAAELRSVGLDADDYCWCQVTPLAGEALAACTSTADGGDEPGFCFIDPENGSGDPSLVASCPADGKFRLRFVGDDLPAAGALTFMDCARGL